MTPFDAPLAARDDVLIPPGARLVHIGPPKTGTTAIQAAFHLARAACELQGVHYAGRPRHSAPEVQAVVGVPSAWSDDGRPPSIGLWHELADEIRRSTAPRVVLSSEAFVGATEPVIRRVIDDLGGQVHVVLTLRSITRLLPSQWQQYVQDRLTKPFDAWLEETLRAWDEPRRGAGGDPASARGFWARHRHDELVRRWAGVVGNERVTVVVVDDRDRDHVFRAFERLVGLRVGTLVPDPAVKNRSLTLAEIEIVRAFNILARANDLPRPTYTRAMRRGAALLLERRRPASSEAVLAVPPSALQRITAISREIVAGITTANVRVMGDLERLVERETTRGGDEPQEVIITPDLAASAAFGVLVAMSSEGDAAGRPAVGIIRGFDEPLELRLSTRQLAGRLARRLGAAVMPPFRRDRSERASNVAGTRRARSPSCE